jgi:hypothetical protein
MNRDLLKNNDDFASEYYTEGYHGGLAFGSNYIQGKIREQNRLELFRAYHVLYISLGVNKHRFVKTYKQHLLELLDDCLKEDGLEEPIDILPEWNTIDPFAVGRKNIEVLYLFGMGEYKKFMYNL